MSERVSVIIIIIIDRRSVQKEPSMAHPLMARIEGLGE